MSLFSCHLFAHSHFCRDARIRAGRGAARTISVGKTRRETGSCHVSRTTVQAAQGSTRFQRIVSTESRMTPTIGTLRSHAKNASSTASGNESGHENEDCACQCILPTCRRSSCHSISSSTQLNTLIASRMTTQRDMGYNQMSLDACVL
jgi:hypothetical protein